MVIEPKGRPHIACRKCRQNVVWPESLSTDEKRQIADVSRKSRAEGASLAKLKLRLELREAKVLSLHISREPGSCHRCGHPVTGEVSICSNCRSANLDW
jgi:hypothetical protein